MRRVFANMFKDFFESEKIAGVLLVICTIISLIISNTAFGEKYLEFWDSYINLSFSRLELSYSFEHWVNDGLMAIFFLLVGLEIERELYVGELANIRNALLPIVAAAGGVLFPALIHLLLNSGTSTQSGFGIK